MDFCEMHFGWPDNKHTNKYTQTRFNAWFTQTRPSLPRVPGLINTVPSSSWHLAASDGGERPECTGAQCCHNRADTNRDIVNLSQIARFERLSSRLFSSYSFFGFNLHIFINLKVCFLFDAFETQTLWRRDHMIASPVSIYLVLYVRLIASFS